VKEILHTLTGLPCHTLHWQIEEPNHEDLIDDIWNNLVAYNSNVVLAYMSKRSTKLTFGAESFPFQIYYYFQLESVLVFVDMIENCGCRNAIKPFFCDKSLKSRAEL
jgi:hypothetical protein